MRRAHWSNYDAEHAHRIDYLATLREAHALYVFDSTSPIQAGEKFRRSHLRARGRYENDEWCASALVYEDRQLSWVNWWLRAHRGHLLSAAADIAAKRAADDGDDTTRVPTVVPRHRAVRFYAKAAERDLMISSANLAIAQRLLDVTSGGVIRASLEATDALRSTKLRERTTGCILRLRADVAPLLCSKAYPDAGPDAIGTHLRTALCPCGLGIQTRAHMLFECKLPQVAAHRETRLVPAVSAANAGSKLRAVGQAPWLHGGIFSAGNPVQPAYGNGALR